MIPCITGISIFGAFLSGKKCALYRVNTVIFKAFMRTKQHCMPSLNFHCLVLVGWSSVSKKKFLALPVEIQARLRKFYLLLSLLLLSLSSQFLSFLFCLFMALVLVWHVWLYFAIHQVKFLDLRCSSHISRSWKHFIYLSFL